MQGERARPQISSVCPLSYNKCLHFAEQVLGAKQQTGLVRHPPSELVSSV